MDLTKTVGYVPGFAPELNLRELGGLPTDDGRTVRRGLFYRGSALAGLGQRERALVDGMGLRYVLDLRAAGEASGNEDYLAEGTDYQRIGGMRFDDGSEVDFSPEAIARFEEMDPSSLRTAASWSASTWAWPSATRPCTRWWSTWPPARCPSTSTARRARTAPA